MTHRPAGDRAAYTLIELLVTIGIIAVLIALLMVSLAAVRASAARVTCQNNLKQIGLALHQFHDQYHTFPAGVKAKNGTFLGFHVDLLPFLEQQAVLKQFDTSLPYSDAKNIVVGLQKIPVFLCPALSVKC